MPYAVRNTPRSVFHQVVPRPPATMYCCSRLAGSSRAASKFANQSVRFAICFWYRSLLNSRWLSSLLPGSTMSKLPAVPTAKRWPSRDAARSHPPSQRNSAAGHRYRYTFRNPTLVDRELPVAITSPRSVLLDEPSLGAGGAGAWARAIDARPIHSTNNSDPTRTQSMRIRVILGEVAARPAGPRYVACDPAGLKACPT